MRLSWAVEVLFRPVLISGGEASPMLFVVVIWPEWVVAWYKDLVSCVRSCLTARKRFASRRYVLPELNYGEIAIKKQLQKRKHPQYRKT